jgi:hypothetical protein
MSAQDREPTGPDPGHKTPTDEAVSNAYRHYTPGCCAWHDERAADRRSRLAPYGPSKPCVDTVDPVYPADPVVAAMAGLNDAPTLPWLECPMCAWEGAQRTVQVCLHGTLLYEFLESRGVRHLDTLVAEYRALRAAAEAAGTYRRTVGLPNEPTTVRDIRTRRRSTIPSTDEQPPAT